MNNEQDMPASTNASSPAEMPSYSEKELSTYLKDNVIGRWELNVRAVVSIFVGWWMFRNYEDLGEKGLGRAFLVAYALIVIIGRQSGHAAAFATIGLLIYVGVWVHMNVLLTDRQRVLKEQFLLKKWMFSEKQKYKQSKPLATPPRTSEPESPLTDHEKQ